MKTDHELIALKAQIESLQWDNEIYRKELLKARFAGIQLSQSQLDHAKAQLDIELNRKKYVSLKQWFALGLKPPSDWTLN